jgi:hypothetical protein
MKSGLTIRTYAGQYSDNALKKWSIGGPPARTGFPGGPFFEPFLGTRPRPDSGGEFARPLRFENSFWKNTDARDAYPWVMCVWLLRILWPHPEFVTSA